eukprot:GFUD01035499.1.p1 GENE.GFUD01035499.1~~GFUD01035499.1.p1  ORF type:complete len:340 (-),score=89.83 GFUD01035499.1:417-1436(-)
MLPQMSGNTSLVPGPDYSLTLHVLESKNVSPPQGSSSTVWLVLFFLVIFLSVVVNTVYVATLLCRRNLTLTHLILCFFFFINLVDYGLLMFEFSLSPSNQFPYSEGSCSFYQFLLQGSPLFSSGTLLLLVYLAYSSLSQPSQSTSLPKLFVFLFLFVFSQSILSIPSILYSRLAVYPSTARYCVMDLSSLSDWAGMDTGRQHAVTAIFFLIYKSVLTYWLPLALVIFPILRMVKMVNTMADNQFTISLTFAVTISFLVFNLPLATIVLLRQLITTLSIPVSSTTTWIIHVLHSLFLLISFFFHIFRPLVCLVLDQDNLPNLCRRKYRRVEKLGEETDQV